LKSKCNAYLVLYQKRISAVRYAGIEATKLGHGGIDYISKLFDIDPKTIRRGIQELELADDLTSNRVRKKRRGQENRP
jgi:hypothetical protein